MNKNKKYPLEIIFRHAGHAELVDAEDNVLWSSDADEDFKESISDEILSADDADDVLQYLEDSGHVTDREATNFESGDWPVTEENDDEDDDEDDEDDDEPEEYPDEEYEE